MATKQELSKYWIKREEEYFASYLNSQAEIDLRMKRYFEMAKRDIDKEIQAFYQRYATDKGISMAEAKKRADKFDVQAFGDRVTSLLKNSDLTDGAKEQLRLYNLTMKTNRLELLRMTIDLEAVRTYSDVELDIEGSLFQEAMQEFERQSGILGQTVGQQAEWIRTIAKADFHGGNFSEAIWGENNAGLLRAKLSETITKIEILGRNPRVYAREFAKAFDTSAHNAERLLNSEASRVNTQVKKESLTQTGIERYEYYAEPTACPTCAALAGTIIAVDDMQPGVNAKPMHPFCFCGILPVVEDKWTISAILAQRAAEEG